MRVDKSRKHIVRMGEDAGWLPTFSPPSTMFQKAYFPEAKVYCLYISKWGKKLVTSILSPFHNVSKGLFPCIKSILFIPIKIVQENKTEGKR